MTTTMLSAEKRAQAKYEKQLAEIRDRPENQKCMDCTERYPKMFNLTHNTIVCGNCAVIHRENGHRIKALTQHTFDANEVERLDKGGNEVARDTYLVGWKNSIYREPLPTDTSRVREFMKMKYTDRRWYRPYTGPIPKQRPQEEEEDDEPEEDTRQRSVSAPPAPAPGTLVTTPTQATPAPDLLGDLSRMRSQSYTSVPQQQQVPQQYIQQPQQQYIATQPLAAQPQPAIHSLPTQSYAQPYPQAAMSQGQGQGPEWQALQQLQQKQMMEQRLQQDMLAKQQELLKQQHAQEQAQLQQQIQQAQLAQLQQAQQAQLQQQQAKQAQLQQAQLQAQMQHQQQQQMLQQQQAQLQAQYQQQQQQIQAQQQHLQQQQQVLQSQMMQTRTMSQPAAMPMQQGQPGAPVSYYNNEKSREQVSQEHDFSRALVVHPLQQLPSHGSQHQMQPQQPQQQQQHPYHSQPQAQAYQSQQPQQPQQQQYQSQPQAYSQPQIAYHPHQSQSPPQTPDDKALVVHQHQGVTTLKQHSVVPAPPMPVVISHQQPSMDDLASSMFECGNVLDFDEDQTLAWQRAEARKQQLKKDEELARQLQEKEGGVPRTAEPARQRHTVSFQEPPLTRGRSSTHPSRPTSTQVSPQKVVYPGINQCGSCNMDVRPEDMGRHRINDCVFRPVGCAICKKSVKFVQHKDHTDLCSRKNHVCHVCGLGMLGSQIPAHQLQAHGISVNTPANLIY